MMGVLYVRDTRNLARRIRLNHLMGNIDGSAFRRHIARAMGFKVLKRRRHDGTVRRRLAEPDGEGRISHYVASGLWRVHPCDTYEQASELQWFAIDRLRPSLNRKTGEWPRGIENSLHDMLSSLQSSRALTGETLDQLPSSPGVYVFYHHFPGKENSLRLGKERPRTTSAVV